MNGRERGEGEGEGECKELNLQLSVRGLEGTENYVNRE